MSDREFDLYLSALSRLLRLTAGQREEIADELRDHLEERFAELTAIGVSHDDAVRRALDEFGDAAGLAAHFTRLSKRRTRRLLMRWTMATVVTASVVAVLASAFWPQAPGLPAPPVVNAQSGGGLGGGSAAPIASRGRIGDAARNAELEKKLAQQMDKVEWLEKPIRDVITEISRKIKADIVVDEKHFEQAGNDLKTPVTLSLDFTKVSARTALEMAMERAGFDDVAITFRDGLIYLTSEARDRYIEVYDCRDLLQGKLISMTIPSTRNRLGGTGGRMGGGGFFSIAAQGGPAAGATAPKAKGRKRKPAKKNAAGHSRLPGGDGAGMDGAMPSDGTGFPARIRTVAQTNAEALIAVIQETVKSTYWLNIDGDGATIAEFNGLLIVTARHEAHAEIQQLLDKLRAATKSRKAAR
jgi:HAAS